MSRVPPPEIDPRTASLIFNRLRTMAPHYTREWVAKDDSDPGVALLKIFSFLAQGVVQRLNRAPERHFLCFLDMLGIRLLPKTPAVVPVRFLVAQGATESILVRSGTQMSAPATTEHLEELPFETTQDLQVVPAALSALFAVDPARDVILKPPPGFLELQVVPALPPDYRVEAFSGANTRALQLDRVNQLEKNDFLRVQIRTAAADEAAGECCSPAPTLAAAPAIVADHLIVNDVKGNIVLVSDPLPRDYDEGTVVQKLVHFDLVNGRNFQEHILYLAHGDLFNVKSEAIFTLLFTHAAGTPSNLDPLRIDWEFFGVLEADPNKEEGWHALNVDSDGTTGLSTNGEIQLSKAAGEIKETEVNGNKSRWIRARLTEPVLVGRALPKVESVVLRIKAGADGIPADLAFTNETPQPAALSFNPFGVEPRIFDRFSLASKEAFSKRGADIVLDLKLDNVDLLASPVALFQDGVLRVFAHGAAGRLLEFPMVINPAKSGVNPVAHGDPSAETRIVAGTSPAAVIDGTTVGVFCRVQDRTKDEVQSIFLRHVPDRSKGSDGKWFNLGSPPNAVPDFNPVAIRDQQTKWRVFTVAGNRVNSARVISSTGDLSENWKPLPVRINDIKVGCTPFVTEGNDQWIFATDDTGKVWRHDGKDWNDLGFTAAKGSRPCAVLFVAGNNITKAKVFIRTPDGGLAYLTTPGAQNSAADRVDFVKPPVLLDSDPFVIKAPDDTLTVYVRGEDKRMWWIEPDAQNPAWFSTDNPVGIDLAGNPFAIFGEIKSDNGNSRILSVFSATKTNSLMERRSDFGPPADVLDAGPRDLIVLAEPVALAGKQKYIQITDGPGKGDVRRIVKVYSPFAPGQSCLALVEKPLSAASTPDTEYRVFEEITEENLQGPSPTDSAKLHNTTNVVRGHFVFAGNQLREIVDISPGNTVTVMPVWSPALQGDEHYLILNLLTVRPPTLKAQRDASKLLVLAQSASGRDDIYADLSIMLRSDSDVTGPHLIAKYSGATRLAQLAQTPDPLPPKQTRYGPIFEGWAEYQDTGRADLRPELSWEYWNGTGWISLRVNDETSNLLFDGKITFKVPENIANTEVAGQDNFWIRARIVGGDYGRELFEVVHDPDDPKVPDQIRIKKDPIRPPLVKSLFISYSYSENLDPRICLTFNNLSYLDQTAANSTDNKYFTPFAPLPGTHPAVHFGFDQPFHSGPVRLYADVLELDVDEQNKPVFTWTFETDNQWKAITAEDETEAFTKPGIITWNLPGVLDEREHFGRELHWVRAVLEKGAWNGAPVLNGLFPNTAMASQFQTYRNEFIGPSDETANQSFRVTHPSVMKGVELRIREVLTDDEHKKLIQAEGEDAIFTTLDVRGQALERWVRWREVEEFSKSTRESRHFRLDPAEGEIEFGDGVHGRIPPAGGDNIQVFKYQAGGGAAGNVRAGEVISLITSVAGIDSVINPIDAGGGSEAATPEDMLEIGPAEISHRFRAVTPEDFEWLAKEASRQVRKARCIPGRNAQGRREAGWVTVYIVPYSTAAKPSPKVQLRRVVRRHLMRCADLNIVSQNHIYVGIPEYVPVDVELTVFARSLDDVARAELNVKSELNKFLHPLTGGSEKKGWEFGRGLTVYDICRLLEDIEEVDHLGPITLHFSGQQSTARADVGPNALITSGEHIITTTVA